MFILFYFDLQDIALLARTLHSPEMFDSVSEVADSMLKFIDADGNDWIDITVVFWKNLRLFSANEWVQCHVALRQLKGFWILWSIL